MLYDRAYSKHSSLFVQSIKYEEIFYSNDKKLDSDTQTYNTSITYPTQHNVGFNHKQHTV